MIFSIYKITNTLNGKLYIGFTSFSVEKRWKVHLRNARAGGNLKYALYQAIRKYGKERFTVEVIYQSPDKEHTVNVMEPFFIAEYNTFGKYGYNQTLGGEAPMLGKKHSDQSKASMSLNSSGSKNPMFGRKHSPETVAKIKEKRKLQVFSEETKQLWSSQRKGKSKPIMKLKMLGNQNWRGKIKV